MSFFSRNLFPTLSFPDTPNAPTIPSTSLSPTQAFISLITNILPLSSHASIHPFNSSQKLSLSFSDISIPDTYLSYSKTYSYSHVQKPRTYSYNFLYTYPYILNHYHCYFLSHNSLHLTPDLTPLISQSSYLSTPPQFCLTPET